MLASRHVPKPRAGRSRRARAALPGRLPCGQRVNKPAWCEGKRLRAPVPPAADARCRGAWGPPAPRGAVPGPARCEGRWQQPSTTAGGGPGGAGGTTRGTNFSLLQQLPPRCRQTPGAGTSSPPPCGPHPRRAHRDEGREAWRGRTPPAGRFIDGATGSPGPAAPAARVPGARRPREGERHGWRRPGGEAQTPAGPPGAAALPGAAPPATRLPAAAGGARGRGWGR